MQWQSVVVADRKSTAHPHTHVSAYLLGLPLSVKAIVSFLTLN